MSSLLCSDEIIEAVVKAACGEEASVRTRHLYRESLRSLVRLAKLEHKRELNLRSSLSFRKSDGMMLH